MDPSADERAARTFHLRMTAADHCPIPGPCPHCRGQEPHYCILGDILQWGESLERALGHLTGSLVPTTDATPERHAEALRFILGRACCAHRQEIATFVARHPVLLGVRMLIDPRHGLKLAPAG
jgi:hypothetical protein